MEVSVSKIFKAGLTCFFIITHWVSAQSIYSFQGLGSLAHQGVPNNVAMGEIGIGSPSSWHVNTQNPANLVFNTFSSFQVGAQVEKRSFSGNGVSGSDFDGGLRFLVYAFPIKLTKWTSSFGILPLSTVNYNTFTTGTVAGDDNTLQVVNETGSGGLTNFFWSNGFVVTQNLYLGIRANYTFGSINKDAQVTIDSEEINASIVNYSDITSYSDLNISLGATYRRSLNETAFINLGVVYGPRTSLNGNNELLLQRLDGGGSVLETVEIINQSIAFDYPQMIGFGISYDKTNKYLIGLDFETQNWKSSSNDAVSFNNSFKIALGARWVPDYDNVNSYFRRATYRLGFNYNRIPYIVNDQSLNDFGINFGASLPISGASSIDLAFKFGQLGAKENGLIKESYYRIVIGASINDRWFIKRRYD